MKKWYYYLMVFILIAGSCKKDNGGEGGSEEETYECLPKKTTYIDHNDATENNSSIYEYDGNAIQKKNYTYTKDDGSTGFYDLKYYYTDKENGVLERIDIVSGSSVLAKVLYETSNGLISHRKLQVVSTDGTQWFDAWDVFYTYDNNNKMVQIRIKDYDLWDEDDDGTREPTDVTGVYTYTGDNVSNIKWYNTDDMSTLKEEYNYEYDQGKRAFANVVTQTYPQTRVNNVTRMEHQIYVPSPHTDITNTTIQYNAKGFPTQFAVTDDRGNALSTQDVEYENCE